MENRRSCRSDRRGAARDKTGDGAWGGQQWQKGEEGDQVAVRSSVESDACTALSALIQAMLTRWRRRGI